WNTYDVERPRNVFFLGGAFLAVGVLDFVHAMSYEGMPDFITPNSPQKAIVFWLVARTIAALAMTVAAVARWKPLSAASDRHWFLLFFFALVITVCWSVLWHPQWVPLFWQEGAGLTRAKGVMEYLCITGYAVSAVLFFRLSRQGERDFDCRGLLLAASAMVISELCFVSYASVTDALNLLGHIYKVVAYLFLYRVLFTQLVRDPYAKLERSRHEIWLEKERAEVTLQSIMDGVITTDAAGNVVSMNPVARQLTGWSLDAAGGQPLSRIFNAFDETDGSPIENPVAKCLRERRAVALSQHAMIVSSFGIAHGIEQMASPIINKIGDIIGVVMVFREVSERRRAQDQLRCNEQRLNEAQAIAHLGSWEWDIASGRLIWSDELFRIFGFKPNSIKPTYQTFLALLHPKDKTPVVAALEKALNGIESYNVEYRVLHQGRKIRYAHALGEVECDQSGKPVKMVGTVLDITERKQTEEILRASWEEIADLYNHTPCGYHSLDGNGIIRRINETELNWLGYSREEVVGKMRFTDLLSNESIKKFHENYPRFKLDGSVRDIEYEMVRKDGSRFFVILSSTAIYDDDGNYLLSRSAITDISDRKAIEHKLVEKEKKLSKAQAMAHLGSWEWDISNNKQSWSDESFRIFGYQPGSIEADHQRFMNLVVDEDKDRVARNIQIALRSGSLYSCEFRIQRPNGDIRHILSQGEVVFDQTGAPVQMIGTNLDITERKQTEEILRTSWAEIADLYNQLQRRALEQRQQAEIQAAILDALPANLALLDAGGVVIAVNRRWQDFARDNGLPQERSGVGSNYLKVPTLEDDEADAIHSTLEGLRGVLSGAIGQYTKEYPCHSPGQKRWYRMLAVPLSTDQRLGAVVMHLDITESWQHKIEIEMLNQQLERRVAERTSQLEAANKELEAFSYSVSHDLRAPLRIIDGFAQILAADYGDSISEDAHRHLDRILYAAKRMGELIDDLLKLSHVSRGDLRLSTVNLSRMAEEISACLKQSEPDRQVLLRIAPDQQVEGDAQLLKIVLENLLANAWKFTRHRDVAEIEFGALHDGKETVYFVRDNGVGFNQKYVHKLFGAFQRLHGEDEFEGTGIGLATVQRIISRHGGSVWAEGVPDKGALFFFKI
ncbi:MAG: MASE3 domain-containing protein, partial [Methylomonas sp.]